MLMLTTIAKFIIRSSIVAPDQSGLKPDTHDETFVMLLMYATFVCTIHYCTDCATSHYLSLFPAKIVHTISTWCLLGMLRRTKLLSHCV